MALLLQALQANTGGKRRVITPSEVITHFKNEIGQNTLKRARQVWGRERWNHHMQPYLAAVTRGADQQFEEIRRIYEACKARGESVPRMLIVATERNQTKAEIKMILALLRLAREYDLNDNGRTMSSEVHLMVTGGVLGREELGQFHATQYINNLMNHSSGPDSDEEEIAHLLDLASRDHLAKNTGHQGHTIAGIVRAFCATERTRPVIIVPVLPLEHGARFFATVLEGLNNLKDWERISARVLFAPILVGEWNDETHGGLTRLHEAFGSKNDPRWVDLPDSIRAKVGESLAKMSDETRWRKLNYAGGIPKPYRFRRIASVLGYTFQLDLLHPGTSDEALEAQGAA